MKYSFLTPEQEAINFSRHWHQRSGDFGEVEARLPNSNEANRLRQKSYLQAGSDFSEVYKILL